MKKTGFLFLALAFLHCAGVRIERVTDSTRNVEGLRYYRPHPYLLVSEGRDGILTSKVIFLPNPDEEYVIRTTAGWGKVDVKAKLDQGWNLVELGEVSDSQTSANLRSLSDLLQVVSSLGAQEIAPLKPGLYLLLYDKGMVSGMKKVF
ncbi:hypothetical protein JW992_02095 [candidate division KSB1 bacterium]|nr:hypothetical protein [candidate division KSB1 bacterium]